MPRHAFSFQGSAVPLSVQGNTRGQLLILWTCKLGSDPRHLPSEHPSWPLRGQVGGGQEKVCAPALGGHQALKGLDTVCGTQREGRGTLPLRGSRSCRERGFDVPPKLSADNKHGVMFEACTSTCCLQSLGWPRGNSTCTFAAHAVSIR